MFFSLAPWMDSLTSMHHLHNGSFSRRDYHTSDCVDTVCCDCCITPRLVWFGTIETHWCGSQTFSADPDLKWGAGREEAVCRLVSPFKQTRSVSHYQICECWFCRHSGIHVEPVSLVLNIRGNYFGIHWVGAQMMIKPPTANIGKLLLRLTVVLINVCNYFINKIIFYKAIESVSYWPWLLLFWLSLCCPSAKSLTAPLWLCGQSWDCICYRVKKHLTNLALFMSFMSLMYHKRKI